MKYPLLRSRLIISLLFLALGAGTALSAPGKGKDKGKSKATPAAPAKGKPGKAKGQGAPTSKPIPPGQAKKLPDPTTVPYQQSDWRITSRFHDRDRTSLTDYFATYKSHPHGLPPGLAKNLQRGKPLPPGWQKKVAQGSIIDNTWWQYFQPVPPGFLPPGLSQPRDTGLYLVGDRLVRVHTPRREVLDVMHVPSIHADR